MTPRRLCVVRLSVVGVASLWLAGPAHALPTFQVYIEGATAGDMAGEDDTWFSTAEPFTLVLVGAYGTHTTGLLNGTLVLSVPQGEQGAIMFTPIGDGTPSLLTTAGSNGAGNPNSNAALNLLTDVGGADGYNEIDDFKPAGLVFSNHAPTGSGSDFILYSVGSFSNAESDLNNYDADSGSISMTNATGEEKRYQVSVIGFSRVHFDLYGLVTVSQGNSGGWERNPGSHDSTWSGGDGNGPVIPEPGSVSLMGMGLAAGWWRVRRSRRHRSS